MNKKHIALIIVVIIALAGAAYFIFSGKSSAVDQQASVFTITPTYDGKVLTLNPIAVSKDSVFMSGQTDIGGTGILGKRFFILEKQTATNSGGSSSSTKISFKPGATTATQSVDQTKVDADTKFTTVPGAKTVFSQAKVGGLDQNTQYLYRACYQKKSMSNGKEGDLICAHPVFFKTLP